MLQELTINNKATEYKNEARELEIRRMQFLTKMPVQSTGLFIFKMKKAGQEFTNRDIIRMWKRMSQNRRVEYANTAKLKFESYIIQYVKEL